MPETSDIAAYVRALEPEYTNGSVVFADFELALAQPVFDMAAAWDNWRYSRLVELLWLVPDISRSLPPLEGKLPDLTAHFQYADVFEVAAFLGRVLHRGGAYTHGKPTSSSLAHGVACAQELFGHDGRAAAFISEAPWCRFFFDVAWDKTVVAVLPNERRVKVLLATDTD